MLILVDNGHGVNTPGKRSPDGRLREYAYCRDIARKLVLALSVSGYDAKLLTPEDSDVSIAERVRRVNSYCSQYGAQNVLLVSVHNNAAGSGGWCNARGWLAIVDDAASVSAKKFAELLFDEVSKRNLKTRQYLPNQKYYYYHQALGKPGVRLGILKNSKCPAVLTENWFQDNREDVEFLMSEQGRNAVVEIHYNAVVNYIENKRLNK